MKQFESYEELETFLKDNGLGKYLKWVIKMEKAENMQDIDIKDEILSWWNNDYGGIEIRAKRPAYNLFMLVKNLWKFY